MELLLLKIVELLGDIEFQFSYLDDYLVQCHPRDTLSNKAWRFYIKYHKYIN